MLPWLLYPYVKHLPGLGVLRYITFRAAMAAATAMLLSLLIGPWVIRLLTRLRMGQHIREEAPSTTRSRRARPPWAGS